MNKKILCITVVFCILSLSNGASKEDEESKEDEYHEQDMDDDNEDNDDNDDKSVEKENDNKNYKGDDKNDNEDKVDKTVEKEKDENVKDDGEKDDDDENDGDDKDEEIKDDKNKTDTSIDDKIEDVESKDEEETKHEKKKDKGNKDQEIKDDKSQEDESIGDESKDVESKDKEETKHEKKKDKENEDQCKIDIKTRFSLELFRKVTEEKHHHSFSLSALPLWKQLSCLLPGAKGDTKKQLTKVLYNGEEEDLKMELFSAKLHDALKVYSRIYVTEDAKLKAEYSPKKRRKRSMDDQVQGDESSEASNEKIEEEDLNSNEKIEEENQKSMEVEGKNNTKEETSKEKKNNESTKEDKHKDDGDLDDLNSKCDYSTLFKQVDFSNVKEVNKTINHDFDKASHHRFKNVLSKGLLDKKTKMLLINAVEFKGKLLESFDEKHTVKNNFFNYKNEKVGTVNMMIKKSTLPYYHSTTLGASILELPYENQMSLFVFLPDLTNLDANHMIRHFKCPKEVMKTLEKMNDTKVEVHLPKFKATGNIHGHLKKALKHMGLVDIFEPTEAKLQGFLEDEADDFGPMIISQSVRFKVNETGSKDGEKVSGSAIKFVCNRPFAFMVIDKEKGDPIITGIFNSPKDIHL